MDYKQAGVDTVKAQNYIKTLKDDIVSTHKKSRFGSVIDNFGGFAGIFNPTEPLKGNHLVASTDGVGTKIELARRFRYFDGLGQDLVAMCINDLYCVGAVPLFFLDYVSCGRLDNSWYFPVLRSITRACEKTGIALLGGETAEHPGVMKEDDFDLAGFIVGSVPPERILPALGRIQDGDIIYGFSSSGLHSNGFSLVRKILARIEEEDKKLFDELVGNRWWIEEELLAPTRIYDFVPELLKESSPKGFAHITGGGIYENLERIIPDGFTAFVEKHDLFKHSIYELLGKYVKPVDMYHAFNMGTGFIAIGTESEKAVFEKYGARVMGQIQTAKGRSKVILAGIETSKR